MVGDLHKKLADAKREHSSLSAALATESDSRQAAQESLTGLEASVYQILDQIGSSSEAAGEEHQPQDDEPLPLLVRRVRAVLQAKSDVELELVHIVHVNI